jgi:hypothetical protein
MAFDISKLARMGEFSMELESLGRVSCLSLTAGHLSQVNKKLGSSDVESHDFVRWLFGEMARRPVEGCPDEADPIKGPSLTAEELKAVTDQEFEEFAGKLIQKNKYLLKTHKGSDIERSVDESACGFLVRAFRHHAAEQKAQWERMTKSVSRPLFSSATLEAMQRNLGLSDQLRDTIDKYTRDLSATGPSLAEPRPDVLMSRMPELHIPKNPIHETNEKLGSVVKQMDDLRPMAAQVAQLIRSMNDAALRMQADYIENAKIFGRQTRIAIWIATISLLVSSFFSYQSYIDAKESGVTSAAQIKAFQSEIRDLAAAQREERAALVKAIVDARRVSPAAVKK